jgi:hypothetical protein
MPTWPALDNTRSSRTIPGSACRGVHDVSAGDDVNKNVERVRKIFARMHPNHPAETVAGSALRGPAPTNRI